MATTFPATRAAAAPARGRPGRTQTCGLGMMLALTSVSMLFIALTSAYIVRSGLDPAWRAIAMPRILLFNTAALALSSVTIERARRTLAARWLAATLALGLLFVCGQLAAWGQLTAAGIYLSTNPHSGFFYLLTALHGLHVAGGLAALGWLLVQAWREVRPCLRERWLGVTALYWHFMDGLWIYLLVLLFVWR